MTINEDKLNQALDYFRQLLKPEEAIPPSPPSDFIPASLVYEHEKVHRQPQSINQLADTPPTPNTFTPVVEPAPVEQNSAPEFVLTPMEADLKEVLRHCLDVENQTLFTVENVLLQQLLRIFLRLEAKMDGLEELISDELIGASKDDQPQPQSQLVFQGHDEEEETEEEIYVQIGQDTSVDELEIVSVSGGRPFSEQKVHDQGTYTRTKIANVPRQEAVITHVPRGSGKPPKEKGNAGKRRRRKRNRKNKR